MSGSTIVGPGKRYIPTPPNRGQAGVRARKIPKKLRKNVNWMEKNEVAAIAGWCDLYRPTGDPNGFELRLDSKNFSEIWVCPIDSEDEEAYIGPYTWEDVKAFAAHGRLILTIAHMVIR